MKQITSIFIVIVIVLSGIIAAPTLLIADIPAGVDETTDSNSESTMEVDIGEPLQTIEMPDADVEMVVEEQSESDENTESTTRGSRALHHDPSDFPEENVYYLVSESKDTLASGRYMDGIPKLSDGRDPKLFKADLHLPHPDAEPADSFDEGHRMYFRFPRNTGTRFDANYNASFSSPPFINITFNTLRTADKEINIEILIDADGDFDTTDPNMADIEGIIQFPIYKTKFPAPSDDIQMEETYEANGTWGGGGYIPQQIRDGAIYLSMWRSDNIYDPNFPFLPDLLVYCGFTNKTSWLGLPYGHTVAPPHANASYDYIKDKNNKWFGIWEPPSQGTPYDSVPENLKMKPFDNIRFNASRSYDINDDYNGNKNIDDGVPAGEIPMADEEDTMQYKWDFGDNTATNWQESPMADHSYQMDASQKEVYYTASVQVRNRLWHTVSDSCIVRIFNEEHPPMITDINIMPQSLDPFSKLYGPRVVENQEVQFTVTAEDNDPWDYGDLRYEWDLDGDKTVDETGETVTWTYVESKSYTIQVWVYDGEIGNVTTLSDTETTTLFVSENVAPVAKIMASIGSDKPVSDELTVLYDQPILFNATMCYDPDNLPGYDVDSPKDYEQDYNLSYKWHWNWEREQAMIKQSGGQPVTDEDIVGNWSFNRVLSHSYTSDDYVLGTNYTVKVYLEVDDGAEIMTSDVFIIYLNLYPIADFYINNKTDLTPLDQQPGVGEKIFFDASLSYDPNDDLDNNGLIIFPELDRLTYSWSFDDGYAETGKMVTHSFATVGDHAITLTVSDGYLTAKKVRHVIIREGNIPPVPVVEISPASGPTHYQIFFKGSDSYDPDQNDDVVKFLWNFGDGFESTEADVTHAFSKEGTYTITLTVTDRRGAQTTDVDNSVYIYNREPYVVLNLKAEGIVNSPVKMDVTAEDSDGEITGYYWDFGDDNTLDWSLEANPAHDYTETGTYTVKVTVKDDKGKTNSSTAQIKIIEPVEPEGPDDEPGWLGVDNENLFFWLIIIIIIVVIVVAIVAIVWRIKREAL
ncbi:MAG: PKD domain-containing protein [Thermoplasmata archaeon]|nr:MAG: PKD domain-containing protein [Thermoplasmata archaeon]